MGLWKMFKEGRRRNLALRTYVDEVEERVRQRLRDAQGSSRVY